MARTGAVLGVYVAMVLQRVAEKHLEGICDERQAFQATTGDGARKHWCSRTAVVGLEVHDNGQDLWHGGDGREMKEFSNEGRRLNHARVLRGRGDEDLIASCRELGYLGDIGVVEERIACLSPDELDDVG